MNKPMLSVHEKKNTLAAKKKPKLVLKNLLVQPFEKYWPELIAKDVDDFVNTFGTIYKSSSSNKNNTSPASSHQSVANILSTDLVHKLKLGLQSSIRCISTGQTLALFISSTIRPKYIVEQIITMTLTQNRTSKIFCVPNIDEVLHPVIGFSCQCLVILENKTEIWNWSLEKSKNFPLPKQLHFGKQNQMEQIDADYFEPPTIVQHEEKVDFTKLYLRKENTVERAFIPHRSMSKNLENNSIHGFIPLGASNETIVNIRPTNQMISKIQKMEKPIAKTCSKLENLLLPDRFFTKKNQKRKLSQNIHNNKVNYVSLKINRVQPNPEKNRNKKKRKNKK